MTLLDRLRLEVRALWRSVKSTFTAFLLVMGAVAVGVLIYIVSLWGGR